MAIDNETFAEYRRLKRKKQEAENKTTLQEVIQFLIDNEQYGDDWKKHIDLLQKIKDKIKIEKNDQADNLYYSNYINSFILLCYNTQLAIMANNYNKYRL